MFQIIKMASGTIDQYMLDEQGVVFSIKGESNAKNAFTSLANYTDVEWSYVSFNDMSFPQIGNSFEEHNNLTMLNSINGKEHLVKEAIHSHPNFPYPSGADKKTVSIIKSIFNNDTAVFSIYHVPSNLFIEYDENGAKYDEYLYEP